MKIKGFFKERSVYVDRVDKPGSRVGAGRDVAKGEMPRDKEQWFYENRRQTEDLFIEDFTHIPRGQKFLRRDVENHRIVDTRRKVGNGEPIDDLIEVVFVYELPCPCRMYFDDERQ